MLLRYFVFLDNMSPAEYNKCVELYADAIFRFIYKQIGNKENAQDIVQDTFEKAWNNRNEFHFSSIKSLLFTIAYRKMIDFIRKNKPYTFIEEWKKIDKPIDDTYTFSLKERLEQALKQLPEIQKTVVLLRDYEGYSYQEIAQITELNETQVKVYIFRARKQLKQLIGQLSDVI